MYYLTKRQEAILYYVLESKETITIKRLASKYQLSERMIHYDIDYINTWLKDQGARLIKNKSYLSWEGTKDSKLRVREALYNERQHNTILSKEERQEFIYNKLLLSHMALTSESLVEDLAVSRPTILKDLKEVGELLENNGLVFMGKKGTGYWVDGKEVTLRSQIINILNKLLIKHHIYNCHDLFARLYSKADWGDKETEEYSEFIYLSQIDLHPIFDMLDILRKENGILVSDADTLALCICMAVMVVRLLQGRTIKKEHITEINRSEESRIFILARGICEQMEDDYNISCSKYEISFMIVTLISVNVEFIKKDLRERSKNLESTIDEMLKILQAHGGVNLQLSHIKELTEDLYEFLTQILRKKRLHIETPNPLLLQTKAGYPDLYKEAVRMAEVFKERESFSLTDAEIALLTVHVAAYEESMNRETDKTVLLICNEGKCLSKALGHRIKNNIPRLNMKGVWSVFELKANPNLLDGVDFIISTVELSSMELPVFLVSPIITAVDIRHIADYITGKKSMQVVDAGERQENYLKDVVMSILSRHLEASQLNTAAKELEYFLEANTGFVTDENTQLIKEHYSYNVSMVIVKLSDMFHRLTEKTGKPVEIDTQMGLVIHIIMSFFRWEKKDFYLEKGIALEGDLSQPVVKEVEVFLEEVEEILKYPVGKCEAAAIIRYLL